MKGRIAWLLALLLLLIRAACAQTVSVAPGELGLALARCADGDVIELCGGVYAEPEEAFPLTVTAAVTLRAKPEEMPVIDAPAFKAALRVEADGVTIEGLGIRFLRTGIYAVGDGLTLNDCRIALADEAWRTSSCGIWAGGIMSMRLERCAFTGCGVSLAGPPLSERSAGLPVLTGLFEVGEDVRYFTTHAMEDCTVNGKPLYYAAGLDEAVIPADAGQAICCGCRRVIGEGVDVSDGSMGMVLAYNDRVELTDCRADRCGVFGVYVAKCGGGTLLRVRSDETNHGIDVRASRGILLIACTADGCDQGMFFSRVEDSVMTGCMVTRTGQGYFLAGGSGNLLERCVAQDCENGFNLQKEGRTLMTGCTVQGCTVCGVRLDATPAEFFQNLLRDNWVGVMAYGDASFSLSGNRFENSGACGLYLRDIGYSRICGNAFSGSAQDAVQALGELSGSTWLHNECDVPPAEASAQTLGLLP